MHPNSSVLYKAMNLKTIFLLFLSILSSSIWSQKIEVQISAKKIEVGEVLTVQFNLTNQNERGMIRGSFEPFQLVGGPGVSQSQQTNIVNGRYSHFQINSYTVQLVAKKLGKLVVPKSEWQLADGSKIASPPIEIEVVKQGTIPRPQSRQPDPNDPFAGFFGGNDPFADPFGAMANRRMTQQPPAQQPQGTYSDLSKANISKDIFAKIHLNKTKCYVGEQISASVKIYTALNAKGFEAEKLPNFNGFWSQEIRLPENLEMKPETINGRQFVSVEIKKILLFPTKPGVLEISPLKMKTVAMVPISKPRSSAPQPRDLFEAIQMMMQDNMAAFGGVEFKEVPFSFSSGTERVQVLPLPANAPASFSGAVGKFNLNSYCNKKELKTDEALNLSIEVQGSGNLPLINNQNIEWDESMEVFDPQISESYSNVPNFNGTKTWKYTAIPHNPGNYASPNVEFTYFDLGLRKYVTLKSPSTPLKITGNPTSKKGKGKSFEEFNYAKQKIKEPKVYSPQSRLSLNLFWIWTLIPLFLGAIVAFFPKEGIHRDRFTSGKKVAAKVRKQMLQAKVYLKENKKKEFYNEMTRAYWSYLGNKLRIEPSLLSRNNIAEQLREKNVLEASVVELLSLIDQCEMGLFTNQGSTDMQDLYERSLIELSELDKQLS